MSNSWQVTASADDAGRRLYPDYYNVECDVDAGCFDVNIYWQYGCGLRFTGINIPKDAVIVSARIRFTARLSYSGTYCNTRLSAYDADNALAFGTKENFDARWNNRTSARVNWDNIGGWTAGLSYYSPQIVSVIQEIVGRQGWNSGNALNIFWEDFEDRSTHVYQAMRCAHSTETYPSQAPVLEITWLQP